MTDAARSRSLASKLFRRAFLGLAVALALVAAAAWLARDLPRRRIERTLGERLGADVRIESISVLGLREFVLRGVVARRLAGQPRVDRIRVARVEAVGSVLEFLEGRFEELGLSGLEVRLGAPRDVPPAAPGVKVTIDRLRIEGGSLVVAGPGRETSVEFDATLTGVGRGLAGALRLRAPRLDLVALLDAARGSDAPSLVDSGVIEDLEGELRFPERRRAAMLDLRARRVLVRVGGTTLSLPGPAVAGVMAEDTPGGPVRLELRPSLPGVRSAVFTADVDAATFAPTSFVAEARGVDLGEIAGLLSPLPPGSGVGGTAELRVEGQGAEVLRYRLSADLDRLELPLGTGAVRASGATLDLSGSAGRDGGAWVCPLAADAAVPRLEGTLLGVPFPADALPLRLEFHGSARLGTRPGVEGAVAIGAGGLGSLEARGDARFFKDRRPEASLAWSCRGLDLERLAATAGTAAAAIASGIAFRGSMSAAGTLAGPIDSPAIDGTVVVDGLGLFAPRSGHAGSPVASLEKGRARARIRWRCCTSPIEVSGLEASASAVVPPLEPVRLTVSASALVDPATARVRVEHGALEVAGLGRGTFDGEAGLAPGSSGSARVGLAAIDLAAWRAFLRPSIGDPLPGYSIRGAVAADADVALPRDGAISGSARVTVSRCGLSSLDGARVLEGFDSSWQVSFENRDRSIALRSSAPLGGFRLLWDTLFLDGSSLTSSLDIEGRATTGLSGPMAWSGRARWSFPDGPLLEASVESSRSGPLALGLALRVSDLATAVRRYVQEPLGGAVPWLDRIDAAGSLSAESSAELAGGAVAVRGRLAASGLRVEGAGGYAEVDGLDLDLPFDLTRSAAGPGGTRAIEGPERTGMLRFARLAVGGLEIPATRTGLSIRGDTVGLDSSLAVPVLGGMVRLANLTLADLARPSRHLETGILLSRLDLAQASRSLGFLPLEGTLEGSFPEVRLSPERLFVRGGGKVSMFGGTIEVGDISGQDVLSGYPKLAFSGSFRDVDLGALTKRFDFGEMTGVISGWVKDCELFRGVPVRFEAELRTEPRKGVPRTVNVKAIDNIAILGTGGRIGVLDRGLHRFLDHYTYDALGIHLSLDNDAFLLRGLERRGARELFLKGRLPFPIDVVNAQPGRTVSFRTMLERVRSLDVSRATTKP